MSRVNICKVISFNELKNVLNLYRHSNPYYLNFLSYLGLISVISFPASS